MIKDIKLIFDIKNKKNWIPLLLFACLCCQFILVVYFNFFQVQNHLGVDASWEYLKAEIIATTGRFYPAELFHDTTAPFFDRNLLMAALLYKLTGNIFVAEGIVNVAFLAMIIIALWAVLSNNKFSVLAKLVVANLLICPYMSNGFNVHNEVGLFSCLSVDAAFYNFRTLELMLFFRLISEPENNKKTKIIAGIAAFMAFVSGAGSGVAVIAVCLLPILVSFVVEMFIKNDAKVLVSFKAIYIYICVAALIVGQTVGRLANLKYVDTGELWISADGFWANVGNEILGYMLLLGAIPTVGVSRSPFSLGGLIYLSGMIIFVVLLIAFIFAIVKCIKLGKNVSSFLLLMIVFSVVTFVEFALLAATYGEVIFERRYVMMGVFCGFILIGYFIDNLSDSLLFKKFGVIALLVSIVSMDLYSDYTYMLSDQDSLCIDEIMDVVDDTDAGLVYFWGKDLCAIDRVCRVLDLSRVYKCMGSNFILEDYGDYTYYDDSIQYQGPTLMITPIGGKYPPKSDMSHYRLLTTLANVEIYYSKENPVDLKKYDEIGNKLDVKRRAKEE